jgi:hypothetical protein
VSSPINYGQVTTPKLYAGLVVASLATYFLLLVGLVSLVRRHESRSGAKEPRIRLAAAATATVLSMALALALWLRWWSTALL